MTMIKKEKISRKVISKNNNIQINWPEITHWGVDQLLILIWVQFVTKIDCVKWCDVSPSCPVVLLLDGKTVVHVSRPAVCRLCHTTDNRYCKSAYCLPFEVFYDVLIRRSTILPNTRSVDKENKIRVTKKRNVKLNIIMKMKRLLRTEQVSEI